MYICKLLNDLISVGADNNSISIYSGSEDRMGFGIIEDEREVSDQVLYDLIGRVRSSITEDLVNFDDQRGLVGITAESIVFSKITDVFHIADEDAEYLINCHEESTRVYMFTCTGRY